MTSTTPSDPSSSFYRLYSGDGSHPSLDGSYLAGCVILGAISGLDPRSLSWVPDGLDPARAEALRAVAQRALEAERAL